MKKEQNNLAKYDGELNIKYWIRGGTGRSEEIKRALMIRGGVDMYGITTKANLENPKYIFILEKNRSIRIVDINTHVGDTIINSPGWFEIDPEDDKKACVIIAVFISEEYPSKYKRFWISREFINGDDIKKFKTTHNLDGFILLRYESYDRFEIL